MTETVRVLIADDHDVVRDGLRMILGSEGGFSVVGEAPNGVETIEQTSALQPQVILMDLRMPKMDGLEAMERIRSAWPEVAVVILTTYDEDVLMLRGLQAGARGYLLKDTNRQTLFDTLRAAARGEALLQPEVIARVLSASPRVRRELSPHGEDMLRATDRELEVLVRVAAGERNKEIAAALGITERTVKAHLASVCSKQGVDSRAVVVSETIRRGPLPASPQDAD